MPPEAKRIKVQFKDVIGVFPCTEGGKKIVLVIEEELLERSARVVLTPKQKKKLIKLLEES